MKVDLALVLRQALKAIVSAARQVRISYQV
jgi:hypothetical protein